MARAVWSGTISFGLVGVPVKLFSAIEQKDVHFHEFEEGTGERIHHQLVAGDDNHPVERDDVVKGYEVAKGRWVTLTPEELEAVEPGRSRTIDIEDFVDLHEVDPIYFERTYYLAPEEAAERQYTLLRDALATAERVAIGRFVMRTKQYLATIRPSEELLLLSTMYFPDEVRPRSVVDHRPGKVTVGKRERDAALQLIESLSSPWDPDRYHDTYRERVEELIAQKAAGKEILTPEPEEDVAPVTDLLEALQASLEAQRGGGRGRKGSGRGRRRTAQAGGRTAAAGGRRGAGRDRFGDMSKAELDAEAKRQGIRGRSKMGKDELVEALRKAS